MSRVCKKITGLFGLALIIGVTAALAGIPPMQQASAASNDVNVQFKVVDDNFMAQIITPVDGSVSYSDGRATAKISYSKAESVNIYLTYPDGHQALVDTVTPAADTGEFEVDLPVSEYGDYTITVSGTNLLGNAMHGDTKAFSYRAVTAQASEDSDKIEVSYGTNVCKLGFQVYTVTDTARENPLLDPEYTMDVTQTGAAPNLVQAEIPDFDTLGPDDFTVVVTAYDCLNHEAIDSDELNIAGLILPPATGAISILGITVSQTDYLITGLAVFVFASILAVFLLTRRKKRTYK